MKKLDKSQLIRKLEDTLKSDEYCYQYKAASVFLIDVMATIRRMLLSGFRSFSDLLSNFAKMNDMCHPCGRLTEYLTFIMTDHQ